MEHLTTLVRGRRSVRTFNGETLCAEDLEKPSTFMAELKNPYGIPVKCPVVSGTDLYLGAKVKRVPHMEEAFGYSFELLVLYAQSLGIGTVWVGGTMDRAAFERAMGAARGRKDALHESSGISCQEDVHQRGFDAQRNQS